MEKLINEIVENARKYGITGQQIEQSYADGGFISFNWLAKRYFADFAPHEITEGLILASKRI